MRFIGLFCNNFGTHEIEYDKKLYWINSPNMYSNMAIYLVNEDAYWYKVPHAHQSFTFGSSTVIESQLEYFKIWDQQRDEIYSYKGQKYTTDYDNSMNPNEYVRKGDNYFRMRVANKDITNNNGYLEEYYWYEDIFWENR